MTTHPPLVFLHGLYMNVESWRPWLDRAHASGFDARAIEWPGHAGAPATLRTNPSAGLGALRFADVFEPVRKDIVAKGDNPVLIGHSVGALMALKLISLGVGRAAVAVTPAPPRGILPFSPHFWWANLPHTNLLGRDSIVPMSRRRFKYAFANTSTRAESDAAYERWVVPESRNIPYSLLGHQGDVDLAASEAPRLLIGAEKDHLTPDALVRQIARAYKRAGAPVEYLHVPGRSHLVCGQAGWEELADQAFAWADAHR